MTSPQLIEQGLLPEHSQDQNSNPLDYWGKGNIPANQEVVDFLAKVGARRAKLPVEWLNNFLRAANYSEMLRQARVHDLYGSDQIVYHNLPTPDYGKFIGRTDELALLSRLLRPYPHSVNHIITAGGVGGVGKSALALKTAYNYLHKHDTLPTEERFDAIIWFSAKETTLTSDKILKRPPTQRTLDDLYKTIVVTLDLDENILSLPLTEREILVRQALQKQRTLLILDNLETVDDERLMTFLREPPAPTKIITTTRHWIAVAYPAWLTGMSETDAFSLVSQECQKKKVELTSPEAAKLIHRTGGVPLAIVWSIAQMGGGQSIDTVLRRLGQPHSDIARFCFEGSIAPLRGTDTHKLLMAMTFFETDISRDALGHVAGLGEDTWSRDEGLARLEQLSLINRNDGYYNMLPLTRQYILSELAQESDFDTHAFDHWIEWVTRPTGVKIEYFRDEAGDDLYRAAYSFVDQAKERIWLLNASTNEVSLNQELQWLEDGCIGDTKPSTVEEQLQNRVRLLGRLLQQHIYYKRIITNARKLHDRFEYIRVVQCPEGRITTENVGYHYLRHMHAMVAASERVKTSDILIRVFLYEAKPLRNKSFAIIDDRYIFIQDNKQVGDRLLMDGLQVIYDPPPDVLKTFESIFEEVLDKSTPASATRIHQLCSQLPDPVEALHKPVGLIFRDLLTDKHQRNIETKALLKEMSECEDAEIHEVLVQTLRSLRQDAAVQRVVETIITDMKQTESNFAAWCQTYGIH
jgi:LuxR family glucitol operon transcriptional activator